MNPGFASSRADSRPTTVSPCAKPIASGVLSFTTTAAQATRANRVANMLIGELAENTGGSPWDEECRLIYSAAEWRKQRVDTWQDDVPDVRTQITMHSFREEDGLVRIVSLGMRKFGQPDLSIRGIASDGSRNVGHLLNICMQSLLEGRRPSSRKLELNLDELRHGGIRNSSLEARLPGAAKRIEIEFRVAKPEAGDPDNRLWTPDYPSSDAPTAAERIHEAVLGLFGDTDRTQYISSGSPQMKAASERARARFFELEATFRKGLAFNERLLVKAPFKVSEGDEYMWVEVIEWQASSVTGILVNDSDHDPKLRHGRRVTLPFSAIYDFVFYKRDGTEEGNETGKVLERQKH